MSSEDPYKRPSEHEPKKSNTALIVIIVLAVLTIPALCICGGAAAWLFLAVRVESLQNEPPFVDGPIIEIPPTEPPAEIEPMPPIEAGPLIVPAPQIEPAAGDEPLSGDEGTAK